MLSNSNDGADPEAYKIAQQSDEEDQVSCGMAPESSKTTTTTKKAKPVQQSLLLRGTPQLQLS